MKISNMKINGYKNLVNCEYVLEDFNVLIGANNSGKSNLLEVFSFLNMILTGSEDLKERLLNEGELDNNKILSHCKSFKDNSISFEIEFNELVFNELYKYSYFIEVIIGNDAFPSGYVNKEAFKYKKMSSTGPMSTAFERENTIVKKVKGTKIQKIDGSEALISLISKIKDIKDSFDKPTQNGIDDIFLLCKTPVLYSSPDVIRESIKKQNFVMKNGRIVALALIEEIDKILKSDKAQYYREILKDVLNIGDINVINIALDLKNLTITFNNKQKNDINELSDGTLIVLNIVTYLVSNKYPIIAIEELENSIHPKLLKKMINLLKNNFCNTQIIITAHSPILLNMVKVDEVSIISNNEYGQAIIEQVKNKKDLIKKLSGPFSSFSDIFLYTEE